MDNTDPVNTPSEQPIAPVVDEASVEAQQLEPASEPDSESDAAFVPGAISWSAAEYIEHERSKRWYLLLVAGAAALALISVFFLKDWMFAALIVVMLIVVVMFAKRPPREINYTLTQEGLLIGQKFFAMDSFRSFGLVKEGAIWNVRLISNKRFVPPVTAYLPDDVGEQVVDVLGALLPLEDIEPDMVDRLVNRSKI